MKRSEMLRVIKERVLEGLITLGSSSSRFQGDYFADQLLCDLEEAGTLPPINNHSFYMDGDNADPNNIIYRTWEPEDEV